MCHLHPQQAEQQSAGQCDITRNAEHDRGRAPGAACLLRWWIPTNALETYMSLAIITALYKPFVAVLSPYLDREFGNLTRHDSTRPQQWMDPTRVQLWAVSRHNYVSKPIFFTSLQVLTGLRTSWEKHCANRSSTNKSFRDCEVSGAYWEFLGRNKTNKCILERSKKTVTAQ